MLHVIAFALVKRDRAPVELASARDERSERVDEDAISIESFDELAAPGKHGDALQSAPLALREPLPVPSASQPSERPLATAKDTMTPPSDSSMPLVRPLPERGTDDAPGNANDGSWTFNRNRNVDLNLGDKTASLGRTMASHGTLELPAPPSPAGMSEGLDAMDVARGFGRGGGVVQAIENVTRDPGAPPEGVAFFEVAIEKSGKISVSVSETTSNREEWERLTGAIAAAVKTKNVRFPDQGKGLRIGVRVEAKVRFPDGRDPKKSATYAAASGLKAHTDKDGLVIDELPSVGVGVRGKVCSGGISFGLTGPMIAGGCSPENIGTHAERTIAAREVYEKRM